MLPNIDGREILGGGEVIGDIKLARGTGVDVPPDESVSIDGKRDSKSESWLGVAEGVCRALVDAGDAVWGISRLPAFIRSTSAVLDELDDLEVLKESPKPGVPDNPLPKRDVGRKGFVDDPKESVNPEEADPWPCPWP
jgi:hypothetical protein